MTVRTFNPGCQYHETEGYPFATMADVTPLGSWVTLDEYNALLAQRDELARALRDFVRLAESASKSPKTNRAWCDYRDMCAYLGDARAVLAKLDVPK